MIAITTSSSISVNPDERLGSLRIVCIDSLPEIPTCLEITGARWGAPRRDESKNEASLHLPEDLVNTVLVRMKVTKQSIESAVEFESDEELRREFEANLNAGDCFSRQRNKAITGESANPWNEKRAD